MQCCKLLRLLQKFTHLMVPLKIEFEDYIDCSSPALNCAHFASFLGEGL